MSTYGSSNRYPGEYDKYAAADLERRMENLDLERRERDRERERERERDREYDRQGARPRRGSFYGGGERPGSVYQAAPGGNYPAGYNSTSSAYTAAPGGNYPAAPGSAAAYRSPSPRPGDPRPVSPYRGPVAVPRPVSPYAAPRPVSPYQAPGTIPRSASPFQAAAIQRAASPYGGGAPIQRAASPYGAPPPIQRAASPYGGTVPLRAASPYHGAVAGGVYTTGGVLEGQPIRAGSRAPSPSPYGGGRPTSVYASPPGMAPSSIYASPATAPPPIYGGAQSPYGAAGAGVYGAPIGAHASPRVMAAPLGDPAAGGVQPQLPPPEGFARPPNRAHPYTQFEMLKIGDLDEMLESMPRMPAVLVPHDVYHEDWIRLMTVRFRAPLHVHERVS